MPSEPHYSIFSTCQLCNDQENESLKESFLSAISHEFKTPLTNLLGFSDILLAKKQSQEEQKLLYHIQQESEKLLQLVNEALHTAEQNKQLTDIRPPQEELFSLKTLCEQIRTPYLLRCKDKGLHFSISNHFENRQDLFYGDPEQLRLILENLLDNALQRTEVGIVELEFGGQYKQTPFFFSISVKGSNAAQPHSRSQTDLYTCQRLLRKMGGRLHMENDRHEDSRFWAELPQKTNSTTPRLLIVDDMEEMHLLLKFYLREKGYLLEFAHNGKQAVEMHQKQPYQLIIMDMRMPIMDGLEATQKIRLWEKEQQQTASTIIGLTADHGQQQRYLSKGCDELLTKPIQRQKLIDIINTSLSPTSPTP